MPESSAEGDARPESLTLRMLRFESRSGNSEGVSTYTTGVMNNVGAPPQELDPRLPTPPVDLGDGGVTYTIEDDFLVVRFERPE